MAGGLGTRLQSVIKNKPKCLAPINGEPFIDILLDDCIKQGLRRFIICVSYMKELVIEHLRDRDDCEIIFSEEDEPLGTGGAIKNAEKVIRSKKLFVLNGDSFCGIDYQKLVDFDFSNNAHISVVVTHSNDCRDYGSIDLDSNKRIISFNEKGDKGHGYINSGVYLFSKEIISRIPEGMIFSLERNILSLLIDDCCFAYCTNNELIDIGTPDRYKIALNYFSNK